MTQKYRLNYIEHIAKNACEFDDESFSDGFIDIDRKITFKKYIENDPLRFDENLYLRHGDDQHLVQTYIDCTNTPGFVASGLFEFHDHGFFGNCALPIDVFRREAIIGEPLCWGIDFATWYAEQHHLGSVIDQHLSRNYIDIVCRELSTHSIHGEAAILSAPGQEIYGHWILDFIPKLHILNVSGRKDVRLLYDNLPEWADYFLNSLGFTRRQFSPHPSNFFKVERAIIPTGSKSGYRLGNTALKQAWAQIQRPDRVDLPVDMLGEKIFLTRAHWKHNTRRSYANREDIEIAAVKRGYRLIAPESLSIPQQIRIMQSARIIVGEDGSALHNIVFAEPGATLGVLCLPERDNLWHLGIAQILQHRIAYYRLPGDETQPLPPESFNDFLDLLESTS